MRRLRASGAERPLQFGAENVVPISGFWTWGPGDGPLRGRRVGRNDHDAQDARPRHG